MGHNRFSCILDQAFNENLLDETTGHRPHRKRSLCLAHVTSVWQKPTDSAPKRNTNAAQTQRTSANPAPDLFSWSALNPEEGEGMGIMLHKQQPQLGSRRDRRHQKRCCCPVPAVTCARSATKRPVPAPWPCFPCRTSGGWKGASGVLDQAALPRPGRQGGAVRAGKGCGAAGGRELGQGTLPRAQQGHRLGHRGAPLPPHPTRRQGAGHAGRFRAPVPTRHRASTQRFGRGRRQ